jgi:hypothetical protein
MTVAAERHREIVGHGDAAFAGGHPPQVDTEERAVIAEAEQAEQRRHHVQAGAQRVIAAGGDVFGAVGAVVN